MTTFDRVKDPGRPRRRSRPRRALAGDGSDARGAARVLGADAGGLPESRPHHRGVGGKGGVGKSTVAVNLAVALAAQGARVGLMDADVYGPNIPRMMGVNAPPPVVNEKIVPLEAHGVKVMSLGFLIERDQPAIWRGPIVMKIVTQFLRDVRVGRARLLHRRHAARHRRRAALAGAGDAGHGAIIVTTPQEVASATRCAARRCSSASACRCSASSRT